MEHEWIEFGTGKQCKNCPAFVPSGELSFQPKPCLGPEEERSGLLIRGVPVEEMPREDLIKALIFYHRSYREMMTPEAINERALGHVEAIKRANRR